MCMPMCIWRTGVGQLCHLCHLGDGVHIDAAGGGVTGTAAVRPALVVEERQILKQQSDRLFPPSKRRVEAIVLARSVRALGVSLVDALDSVAQCHAIFAWVTIMSAMGLFAEVTGLKAAGLKWAEDNDAVNTVLGWNEYYFFSFKALVAACGAAGLKFGGYDYMVGSAKQQRGDDMPSPMTDEQDMLFEEDGEDLMEDEFGSPLMGMADNVMSDIMSTQVRSLSRILGSPFTVQYELTDRTFANIHAPRSVLKRRRSTYRLGA